MIAGFYGFLEAVGFHHPLHPIMAHFSVGMIVGTLIFALIAWLGKRPQLYSTARHTINFGIIAYVLTVLAGFADWIHFYGSAWILPIQMKIILAAVLLPLLIVAYLLNKQAKSGSTVTVIIYALCAVNVIVIGFYGAELVYG
jgi:uncharacterized membrane protein